VVTITALALESIVAAARLAAPAECCGLLLGLGDAIAQAVHARNIAANPNRFIIDPADHIAIRRDARQRDLEVVGFYHSHPHSPPRPSETDRAEAAYSGYLHLIMSLADGGEEARLFRLENDDFVEEALVVSAFRRKLA
jgi:proteasome lid subunit RPN8/RPN11